MHVSSLIVATDGDEDTMDLLQHNIEQSNSEIVSKKLWWGDHGDEEQVLAVEELKGNKYDILMAADVIYEESQVVPLLTTVSK